MTEKSGLLPENPRKIAILTDNQINNKHDDGQGSSISQLRTITYFCSI